MMEGKKKLLDRGLTPKNQYNALLRTEADTEGAIGAADVFFGLGNWERGGYWCWHGNTFAIVERLSLFPEGSGAVHDSRAYCL